MIFSLTSLTFGIAQYILPLSIIHTLNSSTILFIYLFDYFINKITINIKQIVGIIIGMIGVILVSNGRLF